MQRCGSCGSLISQIYVDINRLYEYFIQNKVLFPEPIIDNINTLLGNKDINGLKKIADQLSSYGIQSYMDEDEMEFSIKVSDSKFFALKLEMKTIMYDFESDNSNPDEPIDFTPLYDDVEIHTIHDLPDKDGNLLVKIEIYDGSNRSLSFTCDTIINKDTIDLLDSQFSVKFDGIFSSSGSSYDRINQYELLPLGENTGLYYFKSYTVPPYRTCVINEKTKKLLRSKLIALF